MNTGGRRAVKIGVQIAGFLASLAALGWCVSIALSQRDESGASPFHRLHEAPKTAIAELAALTALSIVLNGMIFRVTLGPVRTLRWADVLAVNALATFLNYLPFKLSLIARLTIHHRRDGVPVPVFMAWMAATAVMALTVIGIVSLIGLFFLSGDGSGWWIALSAAGIAGGAAVITLIARAFEGDRGVARMEAMASTLRLPLIPRILRTTLWRRLHDGFAMLADPGAVTVAVLLRVADLLVHAARVVVAAHIVGQPMTLEVGLLVAASYFVVGAASPFGMLGPREGALAAVAGGSIAAVALVISAVEAVVNLAGAACAIAWLRPDRLLRVTAQADPQQVGS
jgi:hypothetical protein